MTAAGWRTCAFGAFPTDSRPAKPVLALHRLRIAGVSLRRRNRCSPWLTLARRIFSRPATSMICCASARSGTREASRLTSCLRDSASSRNGAPQHRPINWDSVGDHEGHMLPATSPSRNGVLRGWRLTARHGMSASGAAALGGGNIGSQPVSAGSGSITWHRREYVRSN